VVIGQFDAKLREYIGQMLSVLSSGLGRMAPSICAICGAWPASSICEGCVQAFARPVHRCPTCALVLPDHVSSCKSCSVHPPLWDRALAAVSYTYPWDRLIADFKFREDASRAGQLAGLMRNAPWVEAALEGADVLIPMPLAPERQRERGFNQSALLARQLCREKMLDRALLRVVNTLPQSSLPRKDRRGNVENAFAMDPFQRDAVLGRRVLLVDDVMTSGASMSAACEVLRRAGATYITALVFARTGVQIETA
jgi:ComF family protein